MKGHDKKVCSKYLFLKLPVGQASSFGETGMFFQTVRRKCHSPGAIVLKNHFKNALLKRDTSRTFISVEDPARSGSELFC